MGSVSVMEGGPTPLFVQVVHVGRDAGPTDRYSDGGTQ